VAKHVAALRAVGFEVEASPRRGYRLRGWPDALVPEAVLPLIPPDAVLGRAYRHLPECDSTSTEAFTAAVGGAPHGLVVAADHQRAGRGRRGRAWLSPPGRGLTFSVVLRPELPLREAPPLTLACAVGVAEALEQQAGVSPSLKWPNDLLIQGRKCCGILLEMSAELERIDFVVVGVGLNLRTGPADLPPEMTSTATSLDDHLGGDALPPRPRLLAATLQSLQRWTDRYIQEGMAPVRKAWRARAALLGKPVTVHTPGPTSENLLHGTAEDVDNQGALLVRGADGRLHSIHAGDVTLRPA
jgi:BirA family biotin operon repressor/biotin-[acetyl-CoA-carboxylase] ligase